MEQRCDTKEASELSAKLEDINLNGEDSVDGVSKVEKEAREASRRAEREWKDFKAAMVSKAEKEAREASRRAEREWKPFKERMSAADVSEVEKEAREASRRAEREWKDFKERMSVAAAKGTPDLTPAQKDEHDRLFEAYCRAEEVYALEVRESIRREWKDLQVEIDRRMDETGQYHMYSREMDEDMRLYALVGRATEYYVSVRDRKMSFQV